MPSLFRKRLIPNECIALTNDIILYNENDFIVTQWKTLRPKKTLSYGFSLYDIQKGFKISKFYDDKGNFICWYCDIIETDYDEDSDTYVFTDLLTDILVYPDGKIKVVDLDELSEAFKNDLISQAELLDSIEKTDALLKLIYSGDFSAYTEMIDDYDPTV